MASPPIPPDGARRGFRVGAETRFSRTVAECDVYAFAGLTGDFAPQHMDEVAMRASAFGRRIAHGAMLVGFMSRASTLAATEASVDNADETLVNLGYDRIRFVSPVFMGDTITVIYRIAAIDPVKRRTMADVEVLNEAGAVVAVARNILQWVPNAALSGPRALRAQAPSDRRAASPDDTSS
ncbi:MAG: MaoC-like dehydratase [Enterovirga sp.]|jgi:3-hydroxybutyryl-CoA dehydratase|nr:MaoC-like dehydratase [Enterovirga sp.]